MTTNSPTHSVERQYKLLWWINDQGHVAPTHTETFPYTEEGKADLDAKMSRLITEGYAVSSWLSQNFGVVGS